MKWVIAAFLLILAAAEPARTQTTQANNSPSSNGTETPSRMNATARMDYAVIGATPAQERALREQVRVMDPEILPARVVFVPHWKYLDNARIYQLHVPTGFASVMFTHLPSRTIFIDNDRYLGEEWLGHWMAHELGHLALNSPKEEDAERGAKKLRAVLKANYKKS